MTITINETFLYYWLCTVIFETIYSYIAFKIALKQFKKNVEQYEFFMIIIKQLKQMASVKLLWKIIFNPFTYIIVYLIFCFITPLLTPFSLFRLLKKIVGYKTELEKKAKSEEKAMEEAQLISKEWMKNEGYNHPDPKGQGLEP